MEHWETYLQDLNASDPVRQQRALKALGRLGNNRSIPDIIPLLKAPEPAVRGQAVAALARIPHPWIVTPLLKVLQDDRPDLRAQAVRALMRVDDLLRIRGNVYDDHRAYEALLQALADPDAKVVRVAIKILSKPHGIRAISAMEALAAYAERPDWAFLPEVRAAALHALGEQVSHFGRWSPQEAAPGMLLLIRALGDTEPRVVDAAIEAFVRISALAIPALIDTLRSPSVMTRRAALTSLRGIYDQLGRARGPILMWERSHYQKERYEALRTQSREEEQRVMAMLTDTDASVREAAAECLGSQSDSEAISALVAAIEDAPHGVPDALLRLGAEGREALRGVLAHHPRASYVWAIQRHCREKPDTRFVPSLIALLRSDDRNLRTAAASAIGTLKDRRAVEPLIALLPASVDAEREAVVNALGELGDARAIEPLGVILQQAAFGEAGQIIRALGRIGGPGVAELALRTLLRLLRQGSFADRNALLLLLATSRDARAFEPLIALAERPEIVDVEVVVQALGILGDRRAVKPLLDMLQRKDLRRAAVEALGRLGDRAAVEPLLEALWAAPYYPLEIVVALGRLGDRRAIEPLTAVLARRGAIDFESLEALGRIGAVTALEGYLDHPEATVRYGAVKALGAIESFDDNHRAVFQALLKARNDRKGFVRAAATRRLKKLVLRGAFGSP
ncbi:MAG: lyase domain protein repeat-containing protein [Chthonomonadaceae bacterium]|nr:lyase domain protein repeat-containing protein [Chthonomonadaceae bacterium]